MQSIRIEIKRVELNLYTTRGLALTVKRDSSQIFYDRVLLNVRSNSILERRRETSWIGYSRNLSWTLALSSSSSLRIRVPWKHARSKCIVEEFLGFRYPEGTGELVLYIEHRNSINIIGVLDNVLFISSSRKFFYEIFCWSTAQHIS